MQWYLCYDQFETKFSPILLGVALSQFDPEAQSETVDADKIPEDWMGLDVGPKTVAKFSEALEPCKTIVSDAR